MLKEGKFSFKAEILTESIPYFLKFRDKIFVIKIGGKILDEPQVLDVVAEDIVLLSLVGVKTIVVHGGGKDISRTLERFGIKSEFKEGIRKTTDEMMDIIEMVLDGKINGKIVSAICKKGAKAIGISGRDAFSIISKVGEGRVGKVKEVKVDEIKKLLSAGFIPVLSPITVLEDGTPMNTNADEVACELAIWIKAEKLLLLTDEEGIIDKDGNLMKSISKDVSEKLIAEGVIKDGMVPKVRLAVRAVENNVNKVHIISGLIRHSILLEIFTDEGIGTEIVR